MILSIDFETRSPVDLKRSGPYRYFEHPMTEVLCAAFAIDKGPVFGWFPGQPCPYEIAVAVIDGAEISGWNVNFERQCFNHIMGPRHGWPVPTLGQYRDTAAQAAAQALPRSLDAVASALRLPQQKDAEGAALMMRMAKPRRPHKGENPQGIYWNEPTDETRLRLFDYCAQDVSVERSLRYRLKPLSDTEMALWRFDQIINDRGITIDLDLVDDMREIVDQEADRLNDELRKATGGAVDACTQTQRLKQWAAAWYGIKIDSLAKGAIDAVLGIEDLPWECRQAIILWQEASRASVRKLQAADLCVGADGRARGLLLFHGASTGRWSGQLLQPQNFTRGSGLVKSQDNAIALIRHRTAGVLDFVYGHPLAVVSDCLRGIMTAAPGKELIAGDYTNIESRLTAWMSGNEDKLEQFRRQDEGTGPEVYRLAAASIYHCDIDDVTPAQRQTGKTAELALGFGGGVDALAVMSLNYHVDIAEAYPALHDAASPVEREKVDKAYKVCLERGNNTRNLSELAWKACRYTVRAWRRANPATVDTWEEFHSAAWAAFHGNDSADHNAGMVLFRKEGDFLWMHLPSGRALAYPAPGVASLPVPWSDKREALPDQEHKDMLTVLSFKGKSKQRDAFYPGLFFQHSVQATARDILAAGMINAEANGFPVVMSIHDEIICEVPKGQGDLGAFIDAITCLPDWAQGLPLLAKGWRGFRYRKD